MTTLLEERQDQRPTFDFSRAALADYDRTQAVRDRAWRNAKTTESICACIKMDELAAARVKEALFKDTSDRNREESCKLVHINTIRAWVEGKPTP